MDLLKFLHVYIAFAKHQAEIWPGFWIEFIRGKFVHLKYLTWFNFEQLIPLGEIFSTFSRQMWGGRPQWCCRPQLSGKRRADYTRVSFKILLFFMTEDKRATNHHHRQWHQLPNSKTSKSSSLGSRWAREELKKRKIIYIQFPRWWAH